MFSLRRLITDGAKINLKAMFNCKVNPNKMTKLIDKTFLKPRRVKIPQIYENFKCFLARFFDIKLINNEKIAIK